MRRGRGLLLLALAAVVVTPAAAPAAGRGHGGGAFHSPKFSSQGSRGFIKGDPYRSWRQQRPWHAPKDFFHVPVVPFVGTAGSTVVVTGAVGGYGYEPGYAVGPVAPPVASLVEYAHGWYQLRGDGVSAPYMWVWIPRPPPPPAESLAPVPPPAVVSAPPPPPEPPRDVASAGPRLGDTYHWTDDRGVTTWTNRREKVPPRYRDQAPPPDDIRSQ